MKQYRNWNVKSADESFLLLSNLEYSFLFIFRRSLSFAIANIGRVSAHYAKGGILSIIFLIMKFKMVWLYVTWEYKDRLWNLQHNTALFSGPTSAKIIDSILAYPEKPTILWTFEIK